MATYEVLAGGLIAAAGALFGAWLAFSGLKEQIGLEQENIRILQRAYISVEPLGIEPFYSSGGVPDNVVGHVQCRNVGHLPARDFQMSRVRMKWVAPDLIEDETPGSDRKRLRREASVALFNLTPLWTTTSPNRISA
jgi:hypothetical protein